jgi:hypothetical protein
MGYNTDFSGVLFFTEDLTVSQLKNVKKFMGEDCRQHPEWDSGDMTWIDMDITEDYDGIVWNQAEKSYDMVKKINMIVDHMRKTDPKFGFKGEMVAQGEDTGDRWMITCVDGKAVTQGIKMIPDHEIECPNCKHKFDLD